MLGTQTFIAYNVKFQNITYITMRYSELGGICSKFDIRLDSLFFLNHRSWIQLEEFNPLEIKAVSLISAHNVVESGLKLKNINKNEKLTLETFSTL